MRNVDIDGNEYQVGDIVLFACESEDAQEGIWDGERLLASEGHRILRRADGSQPSKPDPRPVLGKDKNGRDVRAGDIGGIPGNPQRWIAIGETAQRWIVIGETDQRWFAFRVRDAETGYETFAGKGWLEDAVFSAPHAPTEAPFSWERAHDILDAICWGCRALARPMPAAPLTYDRFRAVVESAVEEYAPGSRIVTDQNIGARMNAERFVAWVTVPGGIEHDVRVHVSVAEQWLREHLERETATWLVEAARGVPRRETQTVGVEAWFRRIP